MTQAHLGIPWFLDVGAVSLFLPLAAVLRRRASLTRPLFWVLVWCISEITANGVALFYAIRGINNHFTSYIFGPIEAGVLLWAFSYWQEREISRIAIRISIPIVLAALLIIMTFEDKTTFSPYAEPVQSMVVLLVALYTLVSRSLDASESLIRQDWFWVCGSLALQYGSVATLTPLAAALVTTHPQLVISAYKIKVAVQVIAMVGISIGVLQSTPQPRSGISL